MMGTIATISELQNPRTAIRTGGDDVLRDFQIALIKNGHEADFRGRIQYFESSKTSHLGGFLSILGTCGSSLDDIQEGRAFQPSSEECVENS